MTENINLFDFAKFLTKENGLFDAIEFDVVKFCSDQYYVWPFPGCETYLDACANENCKCAVKLELLDVVHGIRSNGNLDFAQKAISFKLASAYSKKCKYVPPYSLAHFMVRAWGRIDAREELVGRCGKVMQSIRENKTIEESLCLLDGLNINRIASWSKVLSISNPKSCFVYDARISMALRLMWSAYINNVQGSVDIDVCNPFILVNGQKKFLNECLNKLPCRGDAGKDGKKRDKRKLFVDSYIKYCDLIHFITDKLIARKKFSHLSDYVREIIVGADIDDSINDLMGVQYAIYCQMVEMAIFTLIGNDYTKRNGSEYYFVDTAQKHKFEDKDLMTPTPGLPGNRYNIKKMHQLREIIKHINVN